MNKTTGNDGIALRGDLNRTPDAKRSGRGVSSPIKGGNAGTPRAKVNVDKENSPLKLVFSPKKQAQQDVKQIHDANTIKFQIEQINLKDGEIEELAKRVGVLEKELATEKAQEDGRKRQLDLLRAQAEAARTHAEEMNAKLKDLQQQCGSLDKETDDIVGEANGEIEAIVSDANNKIEAIKDQYENELAEIRELYETEKASVVKHAKGEIYHMEQHFKALTEVETLEESQKRLKKELEIAKSQGTKYANFVEIASPFLGLVGGMGAVYGVYNNPEMVSEVVGLFGRHVGVTFEGFNELFMGCGMELLTMMAGYMGYVGTSEIGSRAAILVSKLSKVITEAIAWVRSSLIRVGFKYHNVTLMVMVIALLAYYNQVVNAIVAPYYTDIKWIASLYQNDITDFTIDGAYELMGRIFDFIKSNMV